MSPASTEGPLLGLVVPPPGDEVPSDAARLYGTRARFVARSVGIAAVSPQGFDPVVGQVVDRACALREAGAQFISLMGTSISFYRGAAFTEELRTTMQARTGVPCTTMSHAIVRALRALGLRRVAVATAYVDALNERLVEYLSGEGFRVTAIRGLSFTGVQDIQAVATSTLVELALAVHAQDPSADGVFISCGGLLTLDAIVELEARLGKPVTSSSTAGFWDLMRLAGLDPSSGGHGRLFARE